MFGAYIPSLTRVTAVVVMLIGGSSAISMLHSKLRETSAWAARPLPTSHREKPGFRPGQLLILSPPGCFEKKPDIGGQGHPEVGPSVHGGLAGQRVCVDRHPLALVPCDRAGHGIHQVSPG